MKLTFTLLGPPRTKKNHGVTDLRGNKPRQLPSKAYQVWDKLVQPQLAVFRAYTRHPLPLTEPVNITALFYREALVGDAVGFYQALADSLQKGGIVLNDALVVTWDGSRLRKDDARPRVEVTITYQTET